MQKNKLVGVCGLLAIIGCGHGSLDRDGSATGTAGTTGAAGTTGSGGAGPCVTGDEGCACYGNNTCNGTLRCLSRLCVSLTGSGGSAAGTVGSGGTGDGGTTGGAGTTGSAGTSGGAGTT